MRRTWEVRRTLIRLGVQLLIHDVPLALFFHPVRPKIAAIGAVEVVVKDVGGRDIDESEGVCLMPFLKPTPAGVCAF